MQCLGRSANGSQAVAGESDTIIAGRAQGPGCRSLGSFQLVFGISKAPLQVSYLVFQRLPVVVVGRHRM